MILTQDTEIQKMGNFASFKYPYAFWCVRPSCENF